MIKALIEKGRKIKSRGIALTHKTKVIVQTTGTLVY